MQQSLSSGPGAHQVAADASGNFVVVWNGSGQGDSFYGIFGQRYDSEGVPQGGEFRVNSYTTSYQWSPSVASDVDGNFVVVWVSHGGAHDTGYGIFGQRYDSAGVALGSQFHVNSGTLDKQWSPSIASGASGSFVVVWESRQDDEGSEIYGQRYDSAGVALGSEFRVNSYIPDYQTAPSVASDASGNFVVVWASDEQDGYGYGVFGKRYDSEGTAQGGEFRVNSYTTGYQALPSVASDASGNFVVVWNSYDYYGISFGIFGQRYDSAGVAQSAEFRINSYTTITRRFASVASDASGNFVVAWTSNGQDGSNDGVFGQRYDSAGVAQGAEFQINSFTTNRQQQPSVGATDTNQFVVAWESEGQDGSGFGVFGKRYGFAGLPSLSIADVSMTEGSSPTLITTTASLARFTVTLSAPSAVPVTTTYATADGTATAPSDYTAKSATLTLSPGQTSAVIYVVVQKDNVNESDETLFVNLSNPTNATIADGQGVGTILNDDP